MKLNKDQIEQLNVLAENEEVLTIVGINGTKRPFKIKGKIAFDKYDGSVCLNDTCMTFAPYESVEPKKMRNNDVCAIYHFDLDYVENDTLIILEIRDTEGNVIFKNPNKRKYVYAANNNYEEAVEEDYRIEDDLKIKELDKYIGRPLIFENKDGEFSMQGIYTCFGSIRGSSNYGLLVLHCENDGVGTMKILDNSEVKEVYTIDDNGELVSTNIINKNTKHVR